METALKISTITITASLNTLIDLDVLYNNVSIILYTDVVPNNDGFTYIEYGKKKENVIYCRGFHKKLTISHRKKKTGKRFDNQITVILRLYIDDKYDQANLKIFKNGNIQMAGVKSLNHGNKIMDYMKNLLKSVKNMALTDSVEISNFKIQLINSDFKAGFTIKREKLYKLIQTEYKDIFCSFEPCIYPGVKVQYKIVETEKHVTIAVFRSGCVIITGAREIDETNRAYKFIYDLLINHKEEIELINIYGIEYKEIVKKTAKIAKKKNIILPAGYVLQE